MSATYPSRTSSSVKTALTVPCSSHFTHAASVERCSVRGLHWGGWKPAGGPGDDLQSGELAVPGDDVGGDAPALLDVVAVLPRPRADGHGVDGAGLAGAAPRGAADLAGVADVVLEDVA